MTARYDEIAASYSVRPDDYSTPATSVLLELVGPVAGEQVLDLACGHGPIARYLARQGASVLAVDISADLIAAAVALQDDEPLGIEYLVSDVAAPDLLAGRSFDAVVCNFGLSDIDDLGSTLANVGGVLRESGRFVFCILHPCFPGVDRVSGSWPPAGSYYDEGWWLADGELSTLRNRVGANHRTVSTYLNALGDAGLVLDHIAEPAPDEEWASERTGAGRFPVYLVVRAVRTARADPPT